MWQLLTTWFRPSGSTSVLTGTVRDLTAQLQRLLDAPGGSSLIVEFPGREGAFLQFTADSTVIQLDHPLITPAQVAREAFLRSALLKTGFEPYSSSGSDGSRFFECDLPPDSGRAAQIVEGVLHSAFGADSATELRFIGNGLALAASQAAAPDGGQAGLA